jgi:hypothetical protein
MKKPPWSNRKCIFVTRRESINTPNLRLNKLRRPLESLWPVLSMNVANTIVSRDLTSTSQDRVAFQYFRQENSLLGSLSLHIIIPLMTGWSLSFGKLSSKLSPSNSIFCRFCEVNPARWQFCTWSLRTTCVQGKSSNVEHQRTRWSIISRSSTYESQEYNRS